MEQDVQIKHQEPFMSSRSARLFILVFTTLSVSQSAHAGAYGTLGFSIEDIQPDENFDSFTGTGINARLGYNFGRYFGVEAEC